VSSTIMGLRLAIDHGRTLEWSLAHARTGDPVPALWAEAYSPGQMLMLLSAAAHPRFRDARDAYDDSSCPCVAWQCDDCAAAIRAVVPTLALADVLARARAGA
jgi:hypothetical protein